ncbi:MAG: amidohydrolase family protein [Sandaracinaceae bacterium]
MRVALGIALLALSAPALAQEGTVALVGGTVLPVDGDPIENGTLVFRDGVIRSLAAGATPPGDAQVVDCAGKVITPGLIGTQSPIGLVEIDLEPSTRDVAPEGDDVDAVRAAFDAADAYQPVSSLVAVARRGGVTSVLSTPQGGLVAGVSAMFDLLGATPAAARVDGGAALHVSLGASLDGARPRALTRLREVFEEARLYRQRGRSTYDRRGLRELSVSRLDLERLADALAGNLPTVVHASRASDILRAVALGRDLGLRIVVAGGEEAWIVADTLARADVPVILRPLTNLPETFARLHSRYDNAAILARAGVRVILTTHGAHNLRNLRQEAGNAIAEGLDRAVALAALTAEPARVFGVDDRYGTLGVGRVANVVVWTGDPFELTTWAERVFIRGREVPMVSRQTLLRDRYRDLERVPRGQAGLPRVDGARHGAGGTDASP